MSLKSLISKSGAVYNVQNLLEHRDLLRRLSPAVMKAYCRRVRRRQERFAATLKGKKRIEVAFFLSSPSMWKADYLFRMLEREERFHPYVVLLPYTMFKNYDEQVNRDTLELTRKFLEERGFEYVIPYDEKRRKWLDVKKTLNPDIVFFTQPYKDTLRRYYIYHFTDRLSLYIPYSYTSLNMYEANYNLSFHNVVWRNLLESELHLGFARKYAWVGDENCVVTGFPGVDMFFDGAYRPSDPWKPQDKPGKKRLIWAPHHTISGTQNVANHDAVFASNFLTYADFFLQLAEKYADRLQIVFKPHPVLKMKLYDVWGKERTQAYYARWDALPNTQLMEGDYHDLFLTSDAMIHDCGSFTTEYLHLHRPVMYLIQPGADPGAQFNESGLRSFQLHYHGSSEADIERFVLNLFEGNDPMQETREEFYSRVLKPHTGKMPSENIVALLRELL